MRYSIRFKFFAALCCLILFFVTLSWVLNNLFLEKYYFFNKKRTLMESYRLIDRLYKAGGEDVYLELEKLERMQGLHIVIVDEKFEMVYSSVDMRFDSRSRFRLRGLMHEIQNLPEELIKSKVQEITKGGVLIENRQDKRLNSSFISLFSSLHNGDFIFLSTPVAAIEESVKVSNDFYFFTGIITIVIGSILIFFLTGRFTKPILELNDIALGMSTLDFSKRYPVKTNDEIGQLGKSINSLSHQLEKSITELKAANMNLKEDVERKRRIDDMRKEFISSVSHELKTPIALIQGYAEGLKVNVNEDEDSKDFYCDVIIDEAIKMNKLVKQLLELSQLESGGFVLEKSNFNILYMAREAVKKNELLIKDKGINIIVGSSGDDIVVNADYDKIEQVINNYITNAVNHVDENKTIRVNIRKTYLKAEVSVYNSGKHIREEYLSKIWSSFYKIDKARTRNYGGTGLGLSIVKAIQQAHSNNYGVRNVEGGVEFWFEMDVALE